MEVPSVSHPTGRPNFCRVSVTGVTIYFSYETPIAFWSRHTGEVVRKNDWGPTTGKHLNYVDGRSASRVDGEEFERQLAVVLGSGEYTIEESPV